MAPSKALSKALTEPIRPSKPPPSPLTVVEKLAKPESVARYKELLREYKSSIAEEMLLKKHKKLMLLAEHYGIDHTSDALWYSLAHKLADDYIPGFEVRLYPDKKKGRSEDWTEMRLAKLYASVMAKQKKFEEKGSTKSDAAVCLMLSKSGPWKGTGTGKTLHNKFVLAKKTILVALLDRMNADPRYQLNVYQDFFDQMTGNVGEMRPLDK